jgi:hypothetical protein
MTTTNQSEHRFLGLEVTSLGLGTIGLALFFLPVLGIPISACGLVLGLAGLAASGFGRASRRRSAGGAALSALALAANLAIANVPSAFTESRPVLPVSRLPGDRPYVPPPARP